MAKSRAALKLNSPVVKLIAVAGAYFLVADPVNTQVDKLVSKVLPLKDAAGVAVPGSVSKMGNYAAAGAEGLGGYMLLMKGKSTLPKTIVGAILAGAALKRALKATGVITGYQAVPVIGNYQAVPVLGSTASEGYRVNGPGGGYRVNGRGTSAVMGSCDNGTTQGSDLLGG